MKYWWISLALIALAPAWALAQEEEPLDLRPQFVAGQISRYEVWSLRRQHVTIQLGPNAREAETRMELTGEVTWQVDRVEDDGGAICTMTIDWLAMTITDPEGNAFVNDTRRGSGDLEAAWQTLRAMAGTPLTLTVAPDGSIAAARGAQAITANLPEGARALQELDVIELGHSLAVLPDAPEEAAAGQSWTARHTWPHELGWLEQSSRYTLQARETIAQVDVAVVQRTADLQLTPDRERMGMPDDMQVDVRLEHGREEEQTMFDLSLHQIVGQNGTRHTRIRMQSPLGDTGQNIVQIIDESVQTQLLRIAE